MSWPETRYGCFAFVICNLLFNSFIVIGGSDLDFKEGSKFPGTLFGNVHVVLIDICDTRLKPGVG